MNTSKILLISLIVLTLIYTALSLFFDWFEPRLAETVKQTYSSIILGLLGFILMFASKEKSLSNFMAKIIGFFFLFGAMWVIPVVWVLFFTGSPVIDPQEIYVMHNNFALWGLVFSFFGTLTITMLSFKKDLHDFL